ncbi:tripartite tricarboxylate transporter substrate binding protein [Limnohabitans sp. Jir72]|uniref:Bug family tripartite tricarboxylate transporter substrate binding protein n=1 Tax=Limnohabitans sp. Jir72 TaxID=1977909 RepID=UPI001304DACB|nr:tripartite tricarboxylate transporter substrate binding protein [Limnohabitans sp. Jir72]
MKTNKFLATRRHWLACAALTGLALTPAWSGAQSAWPSKPVRIVVPYAPGGANDILARVVAEKLAPALGQPVLIENRAGAGAAVGTEHVARATPDGHTLLMAASGPIAFNPALVAKLSYNPLTDLAPISLVGSFPMILAVNDSFPAKNLAELVAYSKAHADKTNYSHPSASFQLVMELVKAKTGLKALNVPYQGSAPSINAVLTQEVQMTLIDSGPIAALIKSGKLRALAVTSEQRLASYPQVPTLKEQGVDLAVNFWSGLLAPAGTPAPIIKRLQEEMARIMALPDVAERMAKLDIRPVGGSSADFAKTIATEIPLWTQVAKDNNIKAQ